MKSIETLRSEFPLIVNQSKQNKLVYFDNGATTQKPQCVIDSISHYYGHDNANVHRASHGLAIETTQQFERARETVREFINAQHKEEIVWTKGGTESLNVAVSLVAQCRQTKHTNIVISVLEHHANFVPWQVYAQQNDLELRIIPVSSTGTLNVTAGLSLIDTGTLAVAIGHVSNALGNINPVDTLIKKAKEVGAYSVIDGAQAVAHIAVNVQALECDFYTFSGHKLFAPTGIGVLFAKRQLLTQLQPYQYGGEMVSKVTNSETAFASLPYKFEAGTPNIQGVLGLARAIEFISDYPLSLRQDHEHSLVSRLISGLQQVSGCRLFGDLENRIATVSFVIESIDNNDLGLLLSRDNIAVRVGHHCAMPLMNALSLPGTIRASLCVYNTLAEVDHFIECLSNAVVTLKAADNDDESKRSEELKPRLSASKIGSLATKIDQAGSWDEKYRQIMLASKSLNTLTESERHSGNEIFGCESQVWLSVGINDGKVFCQGYATGKIIRGLLAVMFEQLDGQPIDEVLSFDIINIYQQIGLQRHLSESRGNGLLAVSKAIVARLKEY